MKSVEYLVEDSRNLERIFLTRKLAKCDLIITSPPYFNMKNYGNVEGQIGYKQTYDDFIDDLASVFQQCYRISGDRATLWIVVDTVRKNGEIITLPFDLNNRLKKLYGHNSWVLRDIIIWDKYKNVPWHYKGRFKNQFEYVLFYSKKSKYKYNVDRLREKADYKKWWLTYPERYNMNGKPPTNIWLYSIPIRGWGNGYQNHLCPFPFALVERIISLSSDEGDIVFDPFAGSGSVLAIAKVMKRNAIGIDINERYREKFYNEVLVGAEKYWQTRTKELEKIKANIKEFRHTNLQLRKIKASLILAEIIRDGTPGDSQFVLIDGGPVSARKARFCIITPRPSTLKSKLIGLNNCIIDLGKEYKVEFELDILTRFGFLSAYPQVKKLYGYLKDQICKYSEEKSVVELSKGPSSTHTLYSNIKLCLNKSAVLS